MRIVSQTACYSRVTKPVWVSNWTATVRHLANCLPEQVEPGKVCGHTEALFSQEFGLPAGIHVARRGRGDNMMAAIGAGHQATIVAIVALSPSSNGPAVISSRP